MSTIQFIQYSPEQLQSEITAAVTEAFSNLQRQNLFKSQPDYLTRQEVADLFKVNLSTIHN